MTPDAQREAKDGAPARRLWPLVVAFDLAMLAELGIALHVASRGTGDFSATFALTFFALLLPTLLAFLALRRWWLR